MNSKNITTIITLLLILIFTACSSDSNPLIEDKNLNALSQERVTIKASNAEAYSWKQISGIEVILINANTSSLIFIAPDVQTKETLLFELEALMSSITGSNSIKERATVVVSPLEITTENNETNQTTIILKSIKLTIDKTSLNLDENTTLNAVALYSDKSTKDITDKVEWISSDLNAVQITKHHLKTKKDKNIILQAKLNAVTSNAVALEICQEINGHKLPPQPDETFNNSTLLGVDSNSNGVRDDVERYLLDKYKDHHKIVSEIALQSGRAFQIVLENPENARETIKIWNAAKSCNRYFKDDADYYGDEILMNHKVVDYVFKELQLNTKERVRAYLEYNNNLSGGVYKLAISSKVKCDFNVTELLKSK